MKIDLIDEIKGFWNDIATFIFSPECFLCKRKLESFKSVLCDNCIAELERNSSPFCLVCGRSIEGLPYRCCEDSPVDFVYAVGNYKKNWGNLVEAFKLEKKIALRDFLGYELARALIERVFFRDFRYIIPVPTSPLKVRERGYSQTLFLAQVVVKHAGLRLVADGVKRVKFRRSQIGLGKDERRENVKGTFSVVENKIPAEENIIILDDVITTGSTMFEVGSALKQKVKGKLSGLVVARA